MTDDIERISIHEAGHAVAAVALGLEVWTVDIRTNHLVTLTRLSPSEPELMLRWQLAGAVAESLAFGTVDEDGAVSDRVKAKREGFTLTRDLDATDAMVEACWPDVRNLLEDHWLDVERVALALLEGRGTLTGAELEGLVSP